MSLIGKIKGRVQAFLNYKFDEHAYDMRYLLMSNTLTQQTLQCKTPGTEQELYFDDKRVIVSLTTYGKRLHEVYLAIESIMQQTCKPNKIILWLGDELKGTPMPQTLKKQVERGLEIGYCEDLRSYKKLIPTLEAYPDDIIITIDDDVMYAHDTIELLLDSYRKNPEMIHTVEADMIQVVNGNIGVYNKWPKIKEEISGINVFPIGCGSILYPPGSLHREVFNKDVFMDICKYGDDIWFKAMSLMNDYECKTIQLGIHSNQYVDNRQWQNKGLTLVNVDQNLNDKQINAVFSKYKLMSKLL